MSNSKKAVLTNDSELDTEALEEISGGLSLSYTTPVLSPRIGLPSVKIDPRLADFSTVASDQCKETGDTGMMGCPG